MEIILIIFSALVVIGFTILSFYTSVNRGAERFEEWIKKWFNGQK